MENQHRKIVGYRELNQTEIDLMNKVKEKGKELGELHQELLAYTNQLCLDDNDNNETEEIERVNQAGAMRWLAEGKTDLQKGLMSLTRAIAKPLFF